MKRLFFFILLLAAFGLSAFAQRESIELATGWEFAKQNVKTNSFTEAWKPISLPHTWNTLDAQDGPAPGSDPKLGQQRGNYFRGPCWYARRLEIPARWSGKRVFLRFEAAASVARPYLNGQPLGEHRGAFTAFCFEITPLVKFGGTNELRVLVDNSRFADVPPLAGDFNVHGGLYRPVHLIATGPVCLSPLDYASPGVYLKIQSLTKESATIEVKSQLSTATTNLQKVLLDTVLRDAGGKVVKEVNTQVTVGATNTATATQNLSVPQPRLWQGIGDPYLYTVTVQILRDGVAQDEVTQPLGLRTVEITADRGFLLNGEPYPIRGVNRHQEKRDQGWALTRADDEEDIRLIREMGATAIRMAHYPQSARWHDLCDRAGLLVWDEATLVNGMPDRNESSPPYSPVTEAYHQNLEQEMREMVLQLYNHPSIMVWGVFNEIRGAHSAAALPLVRQLNTIAHELDATRPTVAASDATKLPTNHVVDWTCYNVYPGWYRESGDDIGALIDIRFADQEERRVAISEYGAGGNISHHEPAPPRKPVPTGPFHPEEWQCYVHERDWAAIKNNPKLWGSFLWVMFDFASDWRSEGGLPGINDKGMVTQDRKTKKDVYYFYQANWTELPMVRIASRRFTPRKLAATEVKVYSNCAEVELFMNGKSQGSTRPDDIHIARWPNVRLEPGKNSVKAVGKTRDTASEDQCEWILNGQP